MAINGYKKIEARVERIKEWFRLHGFEIEVPFPRSENGFQIEIPFPGIKSQFQSFNAQYALRQENGWELFYRPSSREVSYFEFLAEVGQKFHWTTRIGVRKSINWTWTQSGYWFWAQICPAAPVFGKCEDVVPARCQENQRPPSIEEYLLMYHLHRCDTGRKLDHNPAVWLTTKLRGHALSALGDCGGINVGIADNFTPNPGCGLRLVKVIG
ncbi:MAG: hypothetical protein ACOZBH_01300 [Patescibacteria group bacterium]